jgi:hypothetical protein
MISPTVTPTLRNTLFTTIPSAGGIPYTEFGRVLDYSTQVGPFTIVDQSGEGNTATLYSGRGLTMDAVGDNVTYATGYSSAERTATLLGRFNVVSPVVLGGQSGFFTFYPTATGVWEELTATATVSGDLDWELGSDFDIGDLRVGTEHWTHSDWSDPTADGLNGKTIVDSGPNGYHGVCTGCSGFTGEATIPQTADKNWNKVGYYDGTTNRAVILANGTTDFDFEGLIWFDGFSSAHAIFGTPSNANNSLTIESATSVRFRVSTNQIVTLSLSLPSQTMGTLRLRRVGTTLSVYWNDVLYGSGTVSGVAISPTTFGHKAGTNGWFKGYAHGWNFNTSVSVPTVGVVTAPWLVSASDANDQIDALGTAILEPRLNTQQLNLFGEGELVTTPAAASLDTIKTVSGWIWHDATARTVFDLGTPTVGTTTTALTSSGFTGVTYFVNGASGTTLSAGWNHCVVASTVALATDNIDILAKSGSQIDYDVTLTVAEALVNYNAQKSLYGL